MYYAVVYIYYLIIIYLQNCKINHIITQLTINILTTLITNEPLINMQAISVTQSGKPEEKLELAFRLYDIDRNGSIDEKEMAEIIRVSMTSQLLHNRPTNKSFRTIGPGGLLWMK